MKKCNKEAKKKCAELIDTNYFYNVKHVGIAVSIVRNRIIDKNINVLIREVDAKESKLEAIKEKVKEKHEQVDRDARNYFHRGVGVGILKYVVRYNYHGRRNKLVNKGLTGSKCSRCEYEEDQEHVILC